MKRSLFNLLACISSGLALLLHSTPAEAIFASVKSTGMAAACISYPLDTLVGAYNPAGIAFVGDRVDIEAAWVHDRGSATLSDNIIFPPVGTPPVLNPFTNGKFDGMRTKNIFPVNFGLVKAWCLSCDWELAAGVVLYNRNYQKTTYHQPILLFGRTDAGLEYLHETVSPIIAIKWCDRHSLGISANYQIERIKVNGLQNFDRPVIPGFPGGSLFPGDVTNRGYNYATGWGFTVGYRGQITDCLAIGLTYQPKTSMSRLKKYRGFLAERGKLDIPQKIGAGISYRIIPCLVVAFDVEQIQWSKIKALHNPLLQDGELEPLGSSDGPGFAFRDQWYYRLGLEWTLNECWSLRAGYRFAQVPFKSSDAPVNVLTLDTVESFLTAGATWCMIDCLELSIFGAYGFEHTVTGRDTIPFFLGGGTVRLREQKFALGLALGYNF